MATINEFAGNWTYRSFHNRPELAATADDVLFAMGGDLVLEVVTAGDTPSAELDLDSSGILGKLSFGNGVSISLTVSGTAVSGTVKPDKPPTIRFRATGVEATPTARWIYDYLGYLAPSWPHGKGQRPTIVGTGIRTVEHKSVAGDEIHPAGETFSFIGVLRDRPTGT